ncbi:MAG: PhpK family radical SAM P-methyltransferase [Candidatus Aminicenantes bacterium]|jgi:radical SAM PhpK family P-methyltransferase
MDKLKNNSRKDGNKPLDCLFIGHNEEQCARHVQYVKKMGTSNEVYRELNLNFLSYNNTNYYASDLLDLFARPPSTENHNGKFFNYWGGMSLAIAYLGTYLKRRGFTFDYINSFQEHRTQLAQKLAEENILVIAITTTYYVSYFPILEILQFIKKHNHTARIVVGGPFIANQVSTSPSPDALRVLFEMIGADIYVNSLQGESTLVNIIAALKHRTPLQQVNNIYYRSEKGYQATAILVENNPLAENLVNWNWFADAQPEYINIRTSISCPFKCAFCGFPQKAGKYQALTVESIEKELETLKQIPSVKTVHFIDDTLNFPPARFKGFLKMLIKNKYPFKWVSFFRCQYADRETVELMKESGCLGVFIGYESGNNQMLKNMNKAASKEKYLKGTALLKEYGILTYGSFIIGFPGETAETVRSTLRFIEESQVDFYSNKLWFMDPHSPILAEKEKYGIQGYQFQWTHDTMNSRQACEIIEQSLFQIKNSLHVPDYHFSFQSILHLISKGMSIQTLKSFLTGFNQGIKDKLSHPTHHNIPPEVVEALKKYAQEGYRECNAPLPHTGKDPGRDNLQHNPLPRVTPGDIVVDFELD